MTYRAQELDDDVSKFVTMIPATLPHLAEHFIKLGVEPFAIAHSWFASKLLVILDAPEVTFFWERYLISSHPQEFMCRVCLALLSKLLPKILEWTSASEVLLYLTTKSKIFSKEDGSQTAFKLISRAEELASHRDNQASKTL